MESLLWALDLCAVVYLCLWALRTDKRRDKEAQAAAQEAAQQRAAAARTEANNA
jgi:cytochrome c-type biogenesis protein CcmH/NrfF